MNNAEVQTLVSPLPLRGLGFFSVENRMRIVLCALLPTLLFLCHAALGYWVESYLTTYLPLLALVSLGCIAYLRLTGVVVAIGLTTVLFFSKTWVLPKLGMLCNCFLCR